MTIIDEAGQNFDIDCIGAISVSSNLVLAGDHLQLSPVMISNDDDWYHTSGLKTIQQRAYDLYQEEQEKEEDITKISKTLLSNQYRMNQEILKWSNRIMYNNEIYSGEANKNWQIHPNLAPVSIFNMPDSRESKNSDRETSYQNEKEAEVMLDYIENFLLNNLKIKASKIGCIVPYSAQRDLLSTMIRNRSNKLSSSSNQLQKIKISSVDGFQGSEMDVIILGMVRANDFGNIGFTGDLKRFNVATTRARKHLACFVNCDTYRGSELTEFFRMHKVRLIKCNHFSNESFMQMQHHPTMTQIPSLSEERPKHSLEICLS